MQSVNHLPTKQPINQSTNQLTNQSSNQPTHETTTKQPTNQPTTKPTKQHPHPLSCFRNRLIVSLTAPCEGTKFSDQTSDEFGVTRRTNYKLSAQQAGNTTRQIFLRNFVVTCVQFFFLFRTLDTNTQQLGLFSVARPLPTAAKHTGAGSGKWEGPVNSQ